MIGERIKKIRDENGLTLEAFGNKLSMTRSAIGLIEKGHRNATDRVISDICREFNVNEDWLRTGEGEMFIERSREEEIAHWVGKLLNSDNKNEKTEFTKRFIDMVAKLKEDDLEMLGKMAELMYESHNKKDRKEKD